MRATLRLSSPAWLAAPKMTSSTASWGDAGALERGAEDERGEVVGARVGEGAAIAPEGRADAADEKGIGHAERSKRSVSRERTATISSSLIPCSWSS